MKRTVTPSLENYSLSQLAQYITDTHHSYLRKELPKLSDMIFSLSNHFGDRFTLLYAIKNIISRFFIEIFPHITREETALFALLPNLEKGIFPPNHSPGYLRYLIQILDKEHEKCEQILQELCEVTNNFTPPKNSPPPIISLYEQLRFLKTDCQKHMEIEDLLLNPKILTMETSYNK